jgi:hypothetical protein
MGDLGDRLEIGHVELRVADRLGVDRPRLRREGLAEGVGIPRVDEFHRPAELGQRVVKQLIRAAIEVVGRDDLVAHLGDGDHREGGRGLARGDGHRAGAPLDCGDALLEDVGRRIHQPGVDVAEFLQGEKIRRVLGALEDVGGRLIDRHGAGAGGRVGNLARMQGQRAEVLFGCAHGEVFLEVR